MNWKHITVAGGGVLGSQIALQIAYSGYDVTIWLRSEDSIKRALVKLERLKNIYLETLENMKNNPQNYVRGLSERKDLSIEEIDLLKNQVEEAYHHLHLTTSYEEAFSKADFVIETIAEDPKQKIAFYKEASQYLREETVVATNSSTMLPSTFAPHLKKAENYLALHFANEIWRNNTAEVMGHEGTNQKAYDQVVAFAKSIHMVPLCLKKEQPGYILNSMLVPFLSAAEMLLATGVADVETIDKTWMLGTGAPAGPFRILDIVGLTTAYNIVIMHPDAKDPDTVQGKIANMLKSYIDEGKTGINAGEGFYKYK